MNNFLKRNILDIFLITVSLLITLAMLEGAYRVYLKFKIENTEVQKVGNKKNSVISFMNEKGAWTFDKDVGFNFRPEGYLSGQIVAGKFSGCGQVKHFNSRGNISSREINFNNADIKGALIGSSYTMGRAKDGRLFHEVLSDNLSKKTGKNVLVENYSRDRFGVIQMLDMAAKVATSAKPDFIIIIFNSATIGMPRLWRVVQRDQDGFSNFVWVNEPEKVDLTPQNSRVHRYVLYNKVTPEWCTMMKKAQKEGRLDILANDPVIKAIIKRYNEYETKGKLPEIKIDLTTLSSSFLYNRLIHRNAFWNMGIYKSQNNPLTGLQIDDYGLSQKFLESVKLLNGTGIPYYLVHIPEYPELRTGNEWESVGSGSMPIKRGLALVSSLEKRLDHKILSFLPAIKKSAIDIETLPRKAGPPNMDWHPSTSGVSVYANILGDMIASRLSTVKE